MVASICLKHTPIDLSRGSGVQSAAVERVCTSEFDPRFRPSNKQAAHDMKARILPDSKNGVESAGTSSSRIAPSVGGCTTSPSRRYPLKLVRGIGVTASRASTGTIPSPSSSGRSRPVRLPGAIPTESIFAGQEIAWPGEAGELAKFVFKQACFSFRSVSRDRLPIIRVDAVLSMSHSPRVSTWMSA